MHGGVHGADGSKRRLERRGGYLLLGDVFVASRGFSAKLGEKFLRAARVEEDGEFERGRSAVPRARGVHRRAKPRACHGVFVSVSVAHFLAEEPRRARERLGRARSRARIRDEHEPDEFEQSRRGIVAGSHRRGDRAVL